MRFFLLFPVLACGLLVPSCSSVDRTCISEISDLPLKSVNQQGDSWAESPLRANARYILYGAESSRQKEARIGDYYYVSWYDADPDQKVRLVMHYTQAQTASQTLTRELELPPGREKKGWRKSQFFFAGEERRKKGDILSWRIELYVGGQLVDARQSYLWE